MIPSHMQKPKVLLVIDDRDEAEMYAHGLTPDFEVKVVPSDADLRGHHVDLIVTDDGGETYGPAWQVLERFCASENWPPTVLLTAHIRADRAVRERVARIGCAAFVAKPCTPTALARVLHRVLCGERGIEETRAE